MITYNLKYNTVNYTVLADNELDAIYKHFNTWHWRCDTYKLITYPLGVYIIIYKDFSGGNVYNNVYVREIT